MVKRKIDAKMMKAIELYIREVALHYNVVGAYLFGSFARGEEHDFSDIDVAVIAKNLTEDIFDDRVRMMCLIKDKASLIEPHPISVEDFENNATWLAQEIKKSGIPIPIKRRSK